MNPYSSLCDDMYLNLTLNTEMELPHTRETVLHHFEQVKKKYPSMRNFYCRDKSEFVLEEDKDQGQYRWTTVEHRRLCSGSVNPPDIDEALGQHRLVLDVAPYSLSLSPLDCEALDLLYGFDFTYRGNHNQLVAEALGLCPALEKLLDVPGVGEDMDFASATGSPAVINYEPTITLALDDECRTQARISLETRTNAYQVRTGDYPEEQLSVYVTARQYGSLANGMTFVEALDHLNDICQRVIDHYVIENILHPLQRTIALK